MISPIFIGVQSVRATDSTTETSASSYKVLAPLPCVEGGGVTCSGGNGSLKEEVDFKTYIQYVINLLIAISAVTAVVMIIWGGIEYMTSGAFQTKKDGLDKVTHAVYGLLLVLSSYLILRTIDPRLVEIPTTLVPKLELKDYMTKNASQLMMDRLQSDADRYNLERTKILGTAQKTADELKTKQAKLDNIQAEIDKYDSDSENYDPETNTNDPEYIELLVQRAEAVKEISGTQIEFQKQLADQAFSGVLVRATETTIRSSDQPATVISQLNAEAEKIKGYRKTSESDLQRLGEYNFTDINNTANYTEASVNLLKVETMISSVEAVSYNRNISTNIRMQNGDGSGLSGTQTPAVAKATLQAEINKAKTTAENITDPKLKAELQAKIEKSTAALNAKFGS